MFAPRGWLKRPVPQMMYRTLEASDFFDGGWYRSTQLSAAERLVDPLWHYLDSGWKKGLNPSPLFDTNYYLRHNPDVQELGLNPLFHYLKYGIGEQRHPVETSLQALHSLRGPASPLTLLPTPRGTPTRMTLVLDDFTPRDSGVPYARILIAALQIAEKAEKRLRVLDRRSLAENLDIAAVCRLSARTVRHGFEYRALGPRNENAAVPCYPGEVFLATSWSSASSLLRSRPNETIRYLRSDDETRLYGDSDYGVEAIRTASSLGATEILLDPALAPEKLKASPRKSSSVGWAASWSGETQKNSARKSQRHKILVDLDTRATGHRSALTLEALTSAVASGIVTEASHDIVVLSPDPRAVSLLASINPVVLTYEDFSAVMSMVGESDVFISLARPRCLGLLELAVLARGGIVISRYKGQAPTSGRLVSIEPEGDKITEALRLALPLATLPSRHGSLELRAEIVGSL